MVQKSKTGMGGWDACCHGELVNFKSSQSTGTWPVYIVTAGHVYSLRGNTEYGGLVPVDCLQSNFITMATYKCTSSDLSIFSFLYICTINKCKCKNYCMAM